MNKNSDDKHPAAKNSEQLAWAVWITDNRNKEIFSVTADSESEAKERAVERYDGDDVDNISVDGPFQNSEPGVWQFTYVTEHVERVTVEAPNEQYAVESAEAEREYFGEYRRDIRTEKTRLGSHPDSE